MRRLLIFALVCVGSASAAASTAAPASTARRGRCPPAHAKVIARNAHAIVFKTRVPTYSVSHQPLEPIPVYIGCVPGSPRFFILGAAYSANTCSSTHCEPTIGGITLSGQMVAFERASGSEANPSVGYEGSREWLIVVRNLRTGKTVHSVPTGTASPPEPGFIGTGEAVALVLKADGAVAWITDTNQARNRYEVHALDRASARLLAVGSDIDRRSLTLVGSTLSWRQGGRQMSTTVQ